MKTKVTLHHPNSSRHQCSNVTGDACALFWMSVVQCMWEGKRWVRLQEQNLLSYHGSAPSFSIISVKRHWYNDPDLLWVAYCVRIPHHGFLLYLSRGIQVFLPWWALSLTNSICISSVCPPWPTGTILSFYAVIWFHADLVPSTITSQIGVIHEGLQVQGEPPKG